MDSTNFVLIGAGRAQQNPKEEREGYPEMPHHHLPLENITNM
jgi:hypothetical protein